MLNYIIQPYTVLLVGKRTAQGNECMGKVTVDSYLDGEWLWSTVL